MRFGAALIGAAVLHGGLTVANASTARVGEDFIASMSCHEFVRGLEAYRSGSTNQSDLLVGFYQRAIIDSFGAHLGRDQVERSFDMALLNCDGLMSELVEDFGEDVFDDYEADLLYQFEFENEL